MWTNVFGHLTSQLTNICDDVRDACPNTFVHIFDLLCSLDSYYVTFRPIVFQSSGTQTCGLGLDLCKQALNSFN